MPRPRNLGPEPRAVAGLAEPARAHLALSQPAGCGARRGCGPQGGKGGGRTSPPGLRSSDPPRDPPLGQLWEPEAPALAPESGSWIPLVVRVLGCQGEPGET